MKRSTQNTSKRAKMAGKIDLVLVPGLACTAALWEPQVAALGALARMTVADHTRHDTMTAIALSILATAPPSFALAGLSMGGYIAQEVVRLAPERVTQLALLDTGSRADDPQRAAGRRQLILLAEHEGATKINETLLPMLIHQARLKDAPLVEVIIKMGTDTGVAAFKRQQAAVMGRLDARPFLPTVRCPTLILVGREDALTPVSLSQELASLIPDARLEIIPDCGHLSTLERPEAVSAALRGWLSA
jgi:pimeloyl-ACP methyl ester carboxylesterase